MARQAERNNLRDDNEPARILRDVGDENTMPLVVGSPISSEASDYARERGVAVQIDRDSRLAARAN